MDFESKILGDCLLFGESRIATDVYLFRVVAINKRLQKNGNISSLWIFFSGHVSPRSSFQSMSLENKAPLSRFLRGRRMHVYGNLL